MQCSNGVTITHPKPDFVKILCKILSTETAELHRMSSTQSIWTTQRSRYCSLNATWRSVGWDHTVPVIIFPINIIASNALCRIWLIYLQYQSNCVANTFMHKFLIFKSRHSLVTADAILSTQYSTSSSVFFTKCNDCANSLLNLVAFFHTF